MSSTWFAVTPLLVLLVAGCSSSSPSGNPGAGGENAGASGAEGGSRASGGSASGVKCDPGPGYATQAEPQQVNLVTATLLDQDDEPITDELVQVCGTDICVPGTSSANGSVVVTPKQNITKPAFKFGMGLQTPRFAWLLPDEAEIEFGTVRNFRFPPLESGVELTNGVAATSAGLTLIPAADGRIKLDKLTFDRPEQWRLRAVMIPIAEAPAVVDASFGFELVYAATPTETAFCPPAKLIVENTEGWEPSTEVEVFLHGVDVEQEWAPYGGWAKVTDARVSDDGTAIESTSPGLPLLGVLAFRRK